MRQVSAWGQFWFDLSVVHKVHGAGITTPLCPHLPHPPHRGAYHSTWIKWHDGSPIYYAVDGATMSAMLRDGLEKTGSRSLRMEIALLAVVTEAIEMKLSRIYP